MKKSSLLLLSFSLTVILWCLNYVALIFYLYWTTVWYDILMHLAGGLAIGSLVILLFRINKRSAGAFAIVFLVTMAVAISWEIFEYLIGETFSIEGYVIDTTLDLVLDAIGAILVYLLTTRSVTSRFQQFS